MNNDEEKSKRDLASVIEGSRRRSGGPFTNPYTFWWWLVILILGWIWVVYQMQYNQDYSDAFRQIRNGIPTTVIIAISAYAIGLLFGLLFGLVRAYPPEAPDTGNPPWEEFGHFILAFFRPNTYVYSSSQGFILRKRLTKGLYVVLYNLISVYVEFIRGIPALVFLLVAGFIIIPAINEPVEAFLNVTWLPFYNTFIYPVINALFNRDVAGLEWLFHVYEPIEAVRWRGVDIATGIIGLGMFYTAFASEIFRAGIQSVPKGQVEAAKSLGMTGFQTMRLIVIPQAIRNILPALGNDFLVMIKDTSLVTTLGTNDVTQEAKKWAGSQFTYLPTYAVLSLVYLTMTVTGSLLVQLLERRLRTGRRN